MKFFRNLKHIFAVSVISLAIIFSSVFIFADEFSDSLNGFFLYRTSGGVWQDYFHRHSLTPSTDQIVIINIDEKTLNTLQDQNNSTNIRMLTLAKSDYATLVQKLENVEVRGIAFDIVFQNSDPTEKVLADMMARYTNIVIATDYQPDFCLLTYGSLYNQLSNSGGLRDRYIKDVDTTNCVTELKRLLTGVKNQSGITDDQWDLPILEHMSDPGNMSDADKIDLYCSRSTDGVYTCPGLPRSLYAGTVWGMVDITSAYERPLLVDISHQPYKTWKIGTGGTAHIDDFLLQTLPYALYSASSGTGDTLTRGDLPVYTKAIDTYSYDTRSMAPHILQPYFGPTNSYPSVSMSDVFDMSTRDLIATFHDKYVLVGESGTFINDKKVSPVTGTLMDGVEMHAHFLDGLLQNKMLAKLDSPVMMGLIVVLTIFSVLLYFFIPKYLSPIFAIGILMLVLFVSRYSYDVGRMVLDIFLLFLAGGVITYPVTYMYRFFVVEREKRELQNNFGHYIDPHVVEEIASQGVDIQLGGEKRTLSVLFSDIAGFTTLSESLDPQDLFYLMTSYLSNMTDILIGRGGTLDKYIGDAVMGFFGAPLSYEDHAVRAADTAILMRERLPQFNDDLIKHGMQPIDFRVGIATGEVMVGNIGSHDRFNYTVLGDTVNLASRLEGTGKEYDVHIIIPSATKEALGSLYLTRELDTIAVKGKTQGVRIYELVGYRENYPDQTLYTEYGKALALYRNSQYREAGKLWQTLAQRDPPSRVMMYRCLEILKGNVQVEDGVYHMTHK